MIKLTCPICQDDDIHYIDDDRLDEWFKCEECGKEFMIQEAGWEQE